MMDSNLCPVCGYPGLQAVPWDSDAPSDEICPSCGTHFGYDDAGGGDPTSRVQVWTERRVTWDSLGRGRNADVVHEILRDEAPGAANKGAFEIVNLLEGTMTEVQFPAMRREVLDALAALADPEYQQRVWVRREFPRPGFFDDLTARIHMFYDDCQVLPDPLI